MRSGQVLEYHRTGWSARMAHFQPCKLGLVFARLALKVAQALAILAEAHLTEFRFDSFPFVLQVGPLFKIIVVICTADRFRDYGLGRRLSTAGKDAAQRI